MSVTAPNGFRAAGASPCPVILAADVLSASVPGGSVDTATIDLDLTAEIAHDFNAQALKMLVPWTYDTRTEAVDLAHEFMDRIEAGGIPVIMLRSDGRMNPDGVRDYDLLVPATAETLLVERHAADRDDYDRRADAWRETFATPAESPSR